MKSIYKRIICGVSVAAMLTATLAGCSNADDKKGTTTTASDGTTVEVHKIKALGQDATMQNDIKFAERDQYPVWQEYEELLKAKGLEIDYELVAAEQYKTVIQTRMAAANNLPDIVNITPLDDTAAITLGQKGILLDVAELTKQYSDGSIRGAIDKLYPFADGLTTTPDGHKYWFSNLHVKTYEGDKPAPVGMGITIRRDWREKVQMESPKTADELYKILKAYQEKDTNGNGAKDEVAVIDIKNFSNGIAQSFGLGYAITSVRGDNLTVDVPWYQDGIKDYITYMKKLVDEGLLDTSGLSNITEVGNQKKQENKMALTFDYGLESWLATQTGVEGAAYETLLPLASKEGVEPAAVVEPHTLVWNKYGITNACKDLQGAISFFDVSHSDKAIELLTWGQKDIYYETKDGVNLYKDRVSTKEEAAQKRTRGNPLWGATVFPIIQAANLEYELVSVPDWKKEYQLAVMNVTPWYSTSNASFMAIPTPEQTDRKNQIYTAINTYSEELLTKLILGQESLEDWDSFMKQFETLGLPELQKIDQALVDSYKAQLK